MANKYAYSGPHLEVYTEGFIAGVEAGEALAKSEASTKITQDDIDRERKKLDASALSPEQKRDLDLAFDLVKPSSAVTVIGATQQFGGHVSLVK